MTHRHKPTILVLAAALAASAGTAQAGTYKVLHTFHSYTSDGFAPSDGMIALNGIIYGTTEAGGDGSTNGYGTVFSITPEGTENVLWAFNVPAGTTDGVDPMGRLAALDGSLYGTTVSGASGGGTVFAITPAGSEHVVYPFVSDKLGEHPTSGVIVVGGRFYGATGQGGQFVQKGALFTVTPAGKERVVHSFGATGDGITPNGPIYFHGMLYGTTADGGAYGHGIAYAVTPNGTEQVLYSFGGTPDDGRGPTAELLVVNGTFYGVTRTGGTHKKGTIFKMTQAGVVTVLHSFAGKADGDTPAGALTRVGNFLFGAAYGGGKYNGGTIYSIDLAGNLLVRHDFNPANDGYEPSGALLDVAGTLYGTTVEGGTDADGYGTVFSYAP